MQGTTLTEAELLKQPVSHYMNEAQLAFFRLRLEAEHTTVTQRIQALDETIKAAPQAFSDPLDGAEFENERNWNINMRRRDQQILAKIEAALGRIEDREYGYCQFSGEPIGLRRLLSRPTATLSIESKRLQESVERHRGHARTFSASARFASC